MTRTALTTVAAVAALVTAGCASAVGTTPRSGTTSHSRTTSPTSTPTTAVANPRPAPSRKAAKPSCVGAAALAAPAGSCTVATRTGRLTPSPARAATDVSDAYSAASGRPPCFAYPPTFVMRTCTFGRRDAPLQVALIGNSHAGQWLPAIQAIAAREGWHVTTYLASQCALADVEQSFETPASRQACRDWGRAVVPRVTGGQFDFVIMANKISRGMPGRSIAGSQTGFRQGYARVLRPLHDAGLPVIGIRDTPSPGFDVPGCLAAHADDYLKCEGHPAAWLPAEPLGAAMADVGDPHQVLIDMTDSLCTPAVCPAAVGGVPVYFDVSHLTATYSRTVAPYLDRKISDALRNGSR